MFKHILVPLDGSPLAEQALPLAARLAKVSGGTVTLLYVSNITLEYGPYLAQPMMYTQATLEAETAQAKLYLNDIVRSPLFKDVTVEKNTTSGEVAQCILDFAQQDATDLIVLCSHGRTGFKRWALGSIAQKIARYSTKPVLVVNSGHTTVPAITMESAHPINIFVGLDGSALAETVLQPAAYLSTMLNAPQKGTLHLVRVVQLVQAVRDEATSIDAMNTRSIAEAQAYLQKIEERIQEGDLARLHCNVTSALEISDDTAAMLVREAEQDEYDKNGSVHNGCDIIALATHGRGGLQRWVMGSVAERVLSSTKLPLLIVRSVEEEPEVR